MQTVTVRAAVVADLSELSRLWHEKMILQQQYDRRFALMPDARPKWEAAAMDWLTDSRCRLFVAERDGFLLGYVLGWVKPAPPGLLPEWFGFVPDMTIDAHSYLGGLGQALLRTLSDWFMENNIQRVIAYVPRRATVEQAFWRANGGTEWIDLMWIK